MTDWFAHIIIMCEYILSVRLVLNATFFVLWIPCHRQNTQNKPHFCPHFFSPLLRNLFTMTLVNRSCASSANLMSKPFLIYCDFFSQTQNQLCYLNASKIDGKQNMDYKIIIYTTCHCFIYRHTETHTREAKSFLSTSIYKAVNVSVHILHECVCLEQSDAWMVSLLLMFW